MQRLTALSAALIFLMVPVARADPPTLADLQQLWKQADYAGVVKGCTDALAPGGVTDPADRFKIAWLKAEGQIQLRQADAAVDAFNAAAKETDDARQQSIAKATAILVGRSKDFIYTSQTIKPPPPPKVIVPKLPAIPAAELAPSTNKSATRPRPAREPAVILPRGQFDIIEPVHRTEAMQAMWTDERTDAEHTVRDKIALKSLPAINDALDRINAAEPIAVAAGSADWAQTQKDLLSNAARVAANDAMKGMNAQLLDILKAQVKRRRGQHPKSMPQDQRDALNQMTQSIDQITTALKALPEALNVDKDTYSSQLSNAASLEDRATTVLATD